MKKTHLLLFLLLGALSLGVNLPAQSPVYASYEVYPTFTNEIIKQRLATIANEAVPMRFTSGVRGFVNTYAIKKHERTEVWLGKRDYYFPLFEEYLRKYGLPTDLKYLAVVESSLRPDATSGVGAAGMWQFMPATGREYGLRITAYVDERRDPHKSTDAACRFLRDLYRRFGNWPLALAAYNAGGGRVNRAARKAGSKNFWKVQRFLPRETRNYVPGFIAATYIGRYHHEHNLHPVDMPYDLQVTESTTIYRRMSFRQISNITGVPVETIKILNPSFIKNIIPKNRKGYQVVLPYHAVGSFRRYLDPEYREALPSRAEESKPGATANPALPEGKYKTIKTHYTVHHGDDIHIVARMFDCQVEEIRAWNNMPNYHLYEGQVLTLLEHVPDRGIPAVLLKMRPMRQGKPGSVVNKRSTRPVAISPANVFALQEDVPGNHSSDDFFYYAIKRGESIRDIAGKFPNVSIPQILSDNGIKSARQVKSGSVLLIRRY